MKKFPKLRRIGHPETDGLFDERGNIVIQEKMDGANFRFRLNEEFELTFGSRNESYENRPEEDIPKNFRPTIEHVRENIDMDALLKIVDDFGPVTIYGESMHPHTLEYDWEEVPQFLGFDIWNEDNESWYSPVFALDLIEEIGLDPAPLYGIPGLGTIIPVDEFDIGEWEEPESHYRDGLAEGIVLRNTLTRARAKFVTEEFAEKHGSVKPGTAPEGLSDAKKMAHRYTGPDNRRIRKQVTKLVEDKGYDLEMELMPELGPGVVEDIAVEEADEFIMENWTVDFHQFRKEVNQQCVDTIKDMMTERLQEAAT